jgi:multidrug efflux pump subunit AcrA (membrane-fusion protein)
VYSPELLAAQQELLLAANLQKSIGQSAVPGVPGSSTDLVAAAKRRLQLWDISDAQINEIVRSGQPRRALTLYAPASGVVLEKNVVRGQAIEPGQMLYMIANLGVVWIDVALREADIGSVRAGSGVDAEFAAFAGRPFRGRVTYVYPMLDSASRTVRARVEVANTNGRIMPGMYATVTLTGPSRSALTVPTSAVVRTGDRTLVFVDMGPTADSRQLMPHEIEIGQTAGEYTEVLAGLEPGQRVVTSAQFLLDSESNLAQVMRSMVGQMGAQDMGNMKGMRDMPGMEVPRERR